MKKLLALLLASLMLLSVLAGCEKTPGETSAPETDAPETEATAASPSSIYVAPGGDDAAAGTIDAPLATLDGARLRVRSILPEAKEPVTVYFRGGDYYMDKGVIFDEADSGTEAAPVTYTAYEGETVRFIGGKKVDPSKIAPADENFKARLNDENAKSALLMADVSDYVDVYPEIYTGGREENDAVKPVELYLGSDPVVSARWPNQEGTDFNWFHLDSDRDMIMNDDRSATMYVPDGIAERMESWSDESIISAYLYGTLQYSWITDIIGVTAYDRASRALDVTKGTNQFNRHTAPDGKMFFLNVPEEIDLPLESWVDREKRVVYFYPSDSFDADDVILSTMTDDMLVMNGTAHLVFQDLLFGFTRGNVVYSDGLSDISFLNCTMAHTSAKAAYFYNSDHITLDGCEVFDLAHGGIVISGGDRDTLESSGSVITNCEIHHFNRDGLTYSPDLDQFYYAGGTPYTPAVSALAVGLVISHNRFHDSVHQVIWPESNDIVIEYNEFYDCLTRCNDMGVIYYWNNPTLLGLVIRYNYFHDIGNEGEGTYSIYADCGSMGADIYGNLFVRGGSYWREGDRDTHPRAVILLSQYAHIHNNVFIDTPALFRYGDWSLGTGFRQSDWVLYLYNMGTYKMSAPDRFREVDYDSPVWHAKYDGTIWGNIYDYYSEEKVAEFQAIGDDSSAARKAAGFAPFKTNEVDNNVLIDINTIVNDPDSYLRSLNCHDNLENGDYSLFEDAGNGDYRLTDEGLALVRETCPDFEPLPLDQIGPRK